ncbi:MAG: zinc ribbon domain-containing protein [Halosimplex sp.]
MADPDSGDEPADGAEASRPLHDADAAEGDETREFPCPECGEPLPDGARFCPGCATPIGENGEAVEWSELDGRFADRSRELLADRAGKRRASGRVMVVAGVAVALPLAPLGLFLVSTVSRLSVWTAPLVLLGSWLAPAAYLARARVPAESFARSCYLIAVGTALVPVALAAGDSGLAAANAEVGMAGVTAVSLVVAGLAAVLGRYVDRRASERSRDVRSFEESRDG